MDLTGTVIDGRYVVERLIGLGGMGEVYLASDRRLGRPVALKVMLERFVTDTGYERRFEREALSAAALSHPHIVQVYDAGVSGGIPYLCLEYVEGPTLAQVIARNGALSLSQVMGIADQILEALAYAHARGVVHRDVKPQNILVDRDGRVKLTDFGVASMEATLTTTLAGTVLGTPPYMSPEQAEGGPATAASDLYSLACVLFHLLTGEAPFHAPTPIATALQHLTLPPPSLRALRPDLPRPLDAVLRKAMAKDPADRYPDADAFREAGLAAGGRVGAETLGPLAPLVAFGAGGARSGTGGEPTVEPTSVRPRRAGWPASSEAAPRGSSGPALTRSSGDPSSPGRPFARRSRAIPASLSGRLRLLVAAGVLVVVLALAAFAAAFHQGAGPVGSAGTATSTTAPAPSTTVSSSTTTTLFAPTGSGGPGDNAGKKKGKPPGKGKGKGALLALPFSPA